MFSFLNSAFLIAAAGAVIPLLIHLFSKRKMKVVQFSSLKHLQAMQKRQVRKLKIRQLLLLALRMLIVALAALAFARPVTESGYVGSHAGVSAVVLFDRSASMSQETPDGQLFNVARNHVQSLLETFGESDEVALVSFGAGAETGSLTFGSGARAIEALSDIESGEGRGALYPALQRALEALNNAANFNRELFVISDFQANALPDSTLEALIGERDDESQLKVYALDFSADGRNQPDGMNVGLSSLDFGGQLIEAGSDFTIGFAAKNFDALNKPDLIASLYLDGQRVAQTDFSLSAHEEKRLTFSESVSYGGRHRGRIELSGDDFALDNQLYFSFVIPETFNLLIINNEAGGEYLRLALEPGTSGVRHWRVKQINSASIGSVALEEYDVVALVGLTELSRPESSALSRFVRGGGGAIYFPSAEITPGGFNSSLADFLGVTLDETITINPPGSGYYSLEELDYTHPILQPFGSLFAEGIPDIEFYTTPKFSANPEVVTLARFSGARPALCERRLGSGKIITVGAMLHPGYSALVGHSFFVPLTIRLAEYAGSDLSRYDYTRFVGETEQIPAPRRVDPEEVITLVHPNTDVSYLQQEEAQGAYRLRLPPFPYAGVYELRARSASVDQFAVNVDPAEGALVSSEPEALGSRFALDVEPLALSDDYRQLLEEKRSGRELWKVLLWLVALALALEMFIAGDLFRRREAESV